jgi:hypothetical protein
LATQQGQLVNAVGEGLAPGLAPGAEGLFAGIAVPFGAVWANATASQHVSVLSEIERFV